MNLIDAISSGRPFRRISFDLGNDWMKVVDGELLWVYTPSLELRLSAEDIVATDYEIDQIKPVSVTITHEQFWEAAAKAVEECGSFCSIKALLDTVAHHLGLES